MGYYWVGTGVDTYDWYSFTVSAARRAVIKTITTGTLDLQLYIYSVVSDMNAENPGGTWVSGTGNATHDTAAIDAVAGTTYYVQMKRNSGVGSYVIASGTADPVAVMSEGTKNNVPLLPFTVFANPRGTCARIVYGLSKPEQFSIRMFDLRGRTMVHRIFRPQRAGNFEIMLDTKALPAGVYLVELTAKKTRRVSRLQITH